MTSLYLMDNVVSYKTFDHTCNNALARIRNVIDNVRLNNMFSYRNNVHFEGDQILSKWSFDNGIVQPWLL